jgi:hypothetical protein
LKWSRSKTTAPSGVASIQRSSVACSGGSESSTAPCTTPIQPTISAVPQGAEEERHPDGGQHVKHGGVRVANGGGDRDADHRGPERAERREHGPRHARAGQHRERGDHERAGGGQHGERLAARQEGLDDPDERSPE